MSIETYRCPHCNLLCQSPTCGKAISIQADPVQQRNDIAAAVVAKIKGY